MAAFLASNNRTFFTTPMDTFFFFIDIKILSAKRMAFKAMSFFGVYGNRSITPHHIFSMGNSFKMLWINTWPESALMVNLKTFWNFALMKPIRKTMRQLHFGVSYCYQTIVAFFIYTTKPLPTAIWKFLNFSKESYFWGDGFWAMFNHVEDSFMNCINRLVLYHRLSLKGGF